MANLRDLKKRINATQNIRKITSTMEKVATSKIRKATDSFMSAVPYHDSLFNLAVDLLYTPYHYPGLPENKLYINGRDARKNVILITITSDRGLCGGFNANIIYKSKEFAAQLEAQGKKVQHIPIGKKVIQAFKHQKLDMVKTFEGIPETDPTFDYELFDSFLLPNFMDGSLDELYVTYSAYISVSNQKPTTRQILPLPIMEAVEERKEKRELQNAAVDSLSTPNTLDAENDDEEPVIYDAEPETDLTWETLLPQLAKAMLFKARLENTVSEQIARRMAMKQATDAASDIIKDLKKLYNRTRQAKITNELIEIVTAANAIKK